MSPRNAVDKTIWRVYHCQLSPQLAFGARWENKLTQKQSPTISVIIPCYNEAKNLERGVLDQVHQYLSEQAIPWEVLIVNDESTDNSRALIQEYIEGRDLADVIDEGVRRHEFADCDAWEVANIFWTLGNAIIQTEASTTRRALRRKSLEETFEDEPDRHRVRHPSEALPPCLSRPRRRPRPNTPDRPLRSGAGGRGPDLHHLS